MTQRTHRSCVPTFRYSSRTSLQPLLVLCIFTESRRPLAVGRIVAPSQRGKAPNDCGVRSVTRGKRPPRCGRSDWDCSRRLVRPARGRSPTMSAYPSVVRGCAPPTDGYESSDLLRGPFWRLLHKGESLCRFRDSASVTYGGMLPSDLPLSTLRFILSAKSRQSCKQDCETVDFCNSLL